MLYFKLFNNNNQNYLIFQSSPVSASHHWHFTLELALQHSDLICEYQYPNEGEAKYHTSLILSLIGY